MTDKAFYFTRTLAPRASEANWLVSGVVMAADYADAQAKLNSLLEESKRLDRGSSFSFVDLSIDRRNQRARGCCNHYGVSQ